MRTGLNSDIPIRIKAKCDYTFWMHFTRELIIMLGVGFINPAFGMGVALGVNVAWEWQDGIHNDGFNVIDLLAGLLATVIGYSIHTRVL